MSYLLVTVFGGLGLSVLLAYTVTLTGVMVLPSEDEPAEATTKVSPTP